VPRRAHLAEDLALAEHHRVEPSRDIEQMARRSVVVESEEMRVELGEGHPGEAGEELGDVGVGAVEALGHDVDLGAPARGEDGNLADRVAPGEAGHGLGDVIRCNGQPFQHGERSSAMVRTDDDDGHPSAAYPPCTRWAPGLASDAEATRRCS
jgi:hypothetical protein